MRFGALGLLALVAIASAACAEVDAEDVDPVASTEQGISSSWTSGAFADLRSDGEGDIRRWIIDQPLDAQYTDLDDAARARVAAMFERLYDALDATLAVPCASSTFAKWTTARSAAAVAGYWLRRYYDTATRRWFVIGRASREAGKPRGLALFVVNPAPGRNIVIEVPHKGVDDNTEIEGANLFTAVAARAILVNGGDRCASRVATRCDAGATGTCNGYYGMSDVAHNDENAFFELHVGFDRRHRARFFQIHENKSSGLDAIISDGTTDASNAASPSHTFYRALSSALPRGTVEGCQDGHRDLCGWNNQQGKMTNLQSTNVCTASNAASSRTQRFLHFEQDRELARSWQPVRDALLATWGDVRVHHGGDLGSPQSRTLSASCR